MAHDGVVVCDAIRAQNIARHARALESHPDIISFGHGDVLGLGPFLIFEPSDLQRQKLRFGDLGDHPGQLLLNQLMRGNRLIAKLFTQQRILQCSIVAGHRRAHGSPGNSITRLVQAHQRRAQST